MEKTILVHNVNSEVYRKFAGKCKAEGKKIGHALSDLLKHELGQ